MITAHRLSFFYCLDEPVFTPFDDELQKELNSVKPSEVRNIDPYCLELSMTLYRGKY